MVMFSQWAYWLRDASGRANNERVEIWELGTKKKVFPFPNFYPFAPQNGLLFTRR